MSDTVSGRLDDHRDADHHVAPVVPCAYHWPMADDAAAIDDISDIEAGDELVEEELLVEEISIDGMCGVY